MIAAVGALAVASGMILLAGAGTANAAHEKKIHKSYVCKYVNKPGGGTELLQGGGNPLYVDNHSLAGKGTVAVGETFADAQGFSVVLFANVAKMDPEPGIDACAPGEEPTPPQDTTVTPLLPSVNPATCKAAGSLNVPAQPAGVLVRQTGSGPGDVTFTFSPAPGFVFPAGTDTEVTLTVPAKLTGTQCAQIKGTETSSPKPKPNPSKQPGNNPPALQPTVLGTQTAVPTAVDAGLATMPGEQAGSGALLAEALLGGGLALLMVSGGLALGRRSRGVHEA